MRKKRSQNLLKNKLYIVIVYIMPRDFWVFDVFLKLVKEDKNIEERLEDVIDELCCLMPFSTYLYKLKHEFFWSHLKKRKMTKYQFKEKETIYNDFQPYLMETTTKYGR